MHLAPWLGPAVALAAVLLLIIVLGRVGSRFTLPMLLRGQSGGQARLAVQTSLAIDSKRRLLIVACDGREGLVLLGPHGDVMLGWLDGMARLAP